MTTQALQDQRAQRLIQLRRMQTRWNLLIAGTSRLSDLRRPMALYFEALIEAEHYPLGHRLRENSLASALGIRTTLESTWTGFMQVNVLEALSLARDVLDTETPEELAPVIARIDGNLSRL